MKFFPAEKHRDFFNLEKYREKAEFLCLRSKFMAYGVDGGRITKK